MELVTNGVSFGARQLALRHQSLNEVSISKIRRDAPGGRVRLADITPRLKLREFIPHGCGTNAKAVFANKGL
jgi:hypothetical protein